MASQEKVAAFLAEPRTAILAGVRKDGRAHISPNWFVWDDERFYVSTTRHRVKYAIFRRDPRVQILVDDSTGHRAVFVQGTVDIREDLAAELPRFRAIKLKHGVESPDDETFLAELAAEGRVLLAITPDRPAVDWTTIDLD
jgi:PPOX class probable F420-dependent enzyme